MRPSAILKKEPTGISAIKTLSEGRSNFFKVIDKMASVSLLAEGLLKSFAKTGNSPFAQINGLIKGTINKRKVCFHSIPCGLMFRPYFSNATKCAISCMVVIKNLYLFKLELTVIW